MQWLCSCCAFLAQPVHNNCTVNAQQTRLWYFPDIVFSGSIDMIFLLSKITGLKLVITNIIKIMIIDFMYSLLFLKVNPKFGLSTTSLPKDPVIRPDADSRP